MISGKFNAIAGSSIFLALVAALVAEHRTQTALKEDALSMRSEAQRLAEELAAIRRDGTGSLTQKPVLPDNQEAELLRLRAEIGQLRQSLMTLQRANATTSNQLVAARGVEVPIIYPDAVR